MLDWLAPQVYFTTRTICTDYGETLCNNIFTVTNYPVKIWEFFFFFLWRNYHCYLVLGQSKSGLAQAKPRSGLCADE